MAVFLAVLAHLDHVGRLEPRALLVSLELKEKPVHLEETLLVCPGPRVLLVGMACLEPRVMLVSLVALEPQETVELPELTVLTVKREMLDSLEPLDVLGLKEKLEDPSQEEMETLVILEKMELTACLV